VIRSSRCPPASFAWCRSRPCSPVHGGIPPRPPWLDRGRRRRSVAQSARVNVQLGAEVDGRPRDWVGPAVMSALRARMCFSPGHWAAQECFDAMGLIVADSPRGQHRPRSRASSKRSASLWVGGAEAVACHSRVDAVRRGFLRIQASKASQDPTWPKAVAVAIRGCAVLLCQSGDAGPWIDPAPGPLTAIGSTFQKIPEPGANALNHC